MKKNITRTISLLSLTMILTIVMSVLNMTSVHAADVNDGGGGGGTRANSATSFSGSRSGNVLHGDSTVRGYGNYAKLTLYLATTNDINKGIVFTSDGLIDMENTPATRNDGEPMFVKYGRSIIDREGYTLPAASYANLATSKVDTLIDYKNGEKRYPIYNSSTLLTNSQLSNIGIPEWLTPDDDSNQPAVVSWFKGNDDAVTASDNLKDIILAVSRQEDDAYDIFDRVNNVLWATKSKASFDYKDKKGKEINLSAANVMPEDGVAYWLVIYEPVINYNQDPNKMFFPSTGGNNFLITASDAVLQNMHSGAAGYPSVVKFGNGTPQLTMKSNHCRICNLTWFGYPDWPHSYLPLAYYCPLPCPGVSSDYDGVQSTVRFPFAIGTPTRSMGRLFTIEKSWLRYSGGYLFDEPAGNIDDLIVSVYQSVDNILLYGGYSMFVNGPAGTPAPESPYIRVVGVNGDNNTFTAIPGIVVEMATKDDITTSTLRKQTEANATAWISSQEAPFQPRLTAVSADIKKEEYTKKVTTAADFVRVPYEEIVDRSKVYVSPLLINYKVYPMKTTQNTTISMQNYDVSAHVRDIIEAGNNLSILKKIQVFFETLKDAADSTKYVEPDDTIVLSDGTRLGKNETFSPDWDKFVVFASEKKNINSLDEVMANISNVYFYDTNNKEWILPDGFTFKEKNLYITVIIAVVKAPEPVVLGTNSKALQENELTKAIEGFAVPKINASKITVEKTSVDTTCPGYTSVWNDGWTDLSDPKKPIEHPGYYSYPNCGHPHTLANAKNVVPKTLSVQTAWYWDASMFANVSRLSALRKDGALANDGVTFVFNTTSPFTADNMSNAFETISEYKFVAHRSADENNNGAVKPLQLAAYMNDSTLNSNYLTFMNPYYGGTYPSAYSNPTGNFGENDYSLITSINIPQNATAIGFGNFCSGGSSSSLNIPTKLTGEINFGATAYEDSTFKTYTNVEVNATIKSRDNKAKPFEKTAQYFAIDPSQATNPMYLIQVQSDTIVFNPAFKMKYQDSNEVTSPFKEVWMLAAGEKSFISNDYVKIELTKSNIAVTSPWSRDSEDKVDESGNVRKTPTAKSGSTIKATSNGTTVQVDVFYHVQDPKFVDPAQRAAVQAKNDAKAKQFDDMVTSISNQFKSDGVSFYSNMFQSTTNNTQNKLASPSSFQDLTSKTTLTLAKSVTSTVTSQAKAYYVDVNGTADYTKPTRTIALNGQSIPVNEKWTDTNAVKSKNVLSGILMQKGGNRIKGWYNEDYEGIIVIHKVYVITLNGVESTYAQIHPQHSDSLTKRNELAQPLKFVGGSEILIKDNYGIGAEFRLPTLNINGQTFSDIVIPSKPFVFDIRGSIYDTK